MIGHSNKINEKGRYRLIESNSLTPELLFLNTCYGIETGLAQAAIDAGVKTVIAASGPIPIKYMAQYAESFFKLWVTHKQSVSKTLEVVNREFKDKKIQFTYLGNGRMTHRSLQR